MSVVDLNRWTLTTVKRVLCTAGMSDAPESMMRVLKTFFELLVTIAIFVDDQIDK